MDRVQRVYRENRGRDAGASRLQERQNEEGLRSAGAYGVLAGLFLGCSYWVTRRKQSTVASTPLSSGPLMSLWH